MEPKRELATLGGGCFWCLEPIYDELKGVTGVRPGYAGGQTPNPTYQQVCSGNTGHAEVVQVEFDPSVISFDDILHVFFSVHDPTTRNRQGADVGTQYRSVIFYHSPEQQATARRLIQETEMSGIWGARPIVTEVEPFTRFYPAEEYHHRYYERNPEQGYCRVVIEPKVAKFRQKYLAMLRS